MMPEEKINIAQLQQVLDTATDFETLKDLIVNAPFEQPLAATFLFLGFLTLLITNQQTGLIDRISVSNTELADNTQLVSVVKFEDIKVPLDNQENIIARAIRDQKPYDTTDWYYTFTPALTAEQARLNQASGGIAYSAVFPLTFENGGVLSFSYYQYAENIGPAQRDFMQAYSTIVSAALAKHFTKP